MPFFGEPGDVGRRRNLLERVSFANGVANSQVAGGQNIRAFKRKHQKHLGSPDTNAAHLAEQFDDFVIAKLVNVFEADALAGYMLRQIRKRSDFLAGQAAGAQLLLGQAQKGGGGEAASDGLTKAREDGAGRLAAELLERNGARKRLESWLPWR